MQAADIVKEGNRAISVSLPSSTSSNVASTMLPTSVREPVSLTQSTSTETSVSGDFTTPAADLAEYTTFVTVVQTETVYV